jgi:hypothetical protein
MDELNEDDEDELYDDQTEEWTCPYCGGGKAKIGTGCDMPGCINYEDW